MVAQPFPFLNLPPELRNRVYEVALVESRDFTTEMCPLESSRKNYRTDAEKTAMAIKLVSKAVNRESVPIFFVRNEFYIPFHRSLTRFLQRISPLERQLITSIVFVAGSYNNRRDFTMLRRCTGLRKLVVFRRESCSNLQGYWHGLARGSKSPPVSGLRALLKLRGISVLNWHAVHTCGVLPGDCGHLRAVEARIRKIIAKPRSEASARAQIVHDAPELWKEIKAEKERTKGRAGPSRKRKRASEE